MCRKEMVGDVQSNIFDLGTLKIKLYATHASSFSTGTGQREPRQPSKIHLGKQSTILPHLSLAATSASNVGVCFSTSVLS